MMWQASKAAHLGIITKVRCSQVVSPPELALEAGLLDRVARVKLGIKEGINLSTNIVLAAIVSRSLLSLHIDTNTPIIRVPFLYVFYGVGCFLLRTIFIPQCLITPR